MVHLADLPDATVLAIHGAWEEDDMFMMDFDSRPQSGLPLIGHWPTDEQMEGISQTTFTMTPQGESVFEPDIVGGNRWPVLFNEKVHSVFRRIAPGSFYAIPVPAILEIYKDNNETIERIPVAQQYYYADIAKFVDIVDMEKSNVTYPDPDNYSGSVPIEEIPPSISSIVVKNRDLVNAKLGRVLGYPWPICSPEFARACVDANLGGIAFSKASGIRDVVYT